MSSTLDSLPEVLTLVQVAEYLHLSPRTVVKMLKVGTIRGRQGIRKWLITKSALEEYLDGKEALSSRAGIKEKSARLSSLAQIIPECQGAYDRARGNLAAWERLLGERENILLSQVEGKNEDTRKTALLAAKQGDRDWQQIQNVVNEVRGQVIDTHVELERRKQEWAALTIQIHIFTAALEFLAGAQDVPSVQT